MQSCFTQCVVHPLGNPGSNHNVTARSREQHNTMRALVHVLNLQLRKGSPNINGAPLTYARHVPIVTLAFVRIKHDSDHTSAHELGLYGRRDDSNWIWEEEWCAPQPSIGLAGGCNERAPGVWIWKRICCVTLDLIYDVV
jgi:hypothetical protein